MVFQWCEQCLFCENQTWYFPLSFRSPPPHGTREPNTCFRFSSSGIFGGTWTAATHIWGLPLHVPNHCVWKPLHHPGRQLKSPPAHPHVLLPLQSVLCRHLLHLHNNPKDAVEYPDPEQSYKLWRLHHPDVLFRTVCRVGWLPPDCDGLWPLCGDLPPPALHSHHECLALWTAGVGVLGHQCPTLLLANFNGVEIVLWQRGDNPSLFLWTQTVGPTCLFWHLS